MSCAVAPAPAVVMDIDNSTRYPREALPLQTLRAPLWTQVSAATPSSAGASQAELIHRDRDIVLRHEKSFHALDRPQRNNPPPRANNTTDAIAAPPSMHPTPQSTQPMMKQEPEPRRPDFDPQILQQPAHEVIPAFQNQFTQHAAQQQPQAPPPQQIHPAFYPQYRQAPPNPDFHHAFNHHMQQGPPQHMQAPNNMTFPNQQQLDPRLWGSPTPEASNSTLDPALREYDQQHRTGSGSSPSSYVKTEENGEQLS